MAGDVVHLDEFCFGMLTTLVDEFCFEMLTTFKPDHFTGGDAVTVLAVAQVGFGV